MGGIPWVVMSEVQLLLKRASEVENHYINLIPLHCFIVPDISNKCERSSWKLGDSGELVGILDHYVFIQLSSAVELSRSSSAQFLIFFVIFQIFYVKKKKKLRLD